MSPQKTVLRHIRRSREITLAELAFATRISESTLSEGERGLIRFTEKQQQALETYFGIPADRLLAPFTEEAVA